MFRDGDDLFARIAEHNEHTKVHCVFVDEAQFLEEEQVWQLARVADRLGIPVMCYGLRTDFQGKLFSGSHALLAIADELREVRTICRCGKKATMVVQARAGRQGGQAGRAGGDRQGRLCLALPPPLGRGNGPRCRPRISSDLPAAEAAEIGSFAPIPTRQKFRDGGLA